MLTSGTGKRSSAKEDRNLDFTCVKQSKTVYKCTPRDRAVSWLYEYDYIDLHPAKGYHLCDNIRNWRKSLPGAILQRSGKTKLQRQYGAIFLEQIGDKLASGKPHDGRAPDYDDWKLNGDIIVYYPVLDMALELSSMGIRVDEDSLKEQLDKGRLSKSVLELPFQKATFEQRTSVYDRRRNRTVQNLYVLPQKGSYR